RAARLFEKLVADVPADFPGRSRRGAREAEDGGLLENDDRAARALAGEEDRRERGEVRLVAGDEAAGRERVEPGGGPARVVVGREAGFAGDRGVEAEPFGERFGGLPRADEAAVPDEVRGYGAAAAQRFANPGELTAALVAE